MKSLIKYIGGLTTRQALAIVVMAAFPLFLILSLNVLFELGIPYNPMTYLSALFLYWACKPRIVFPPIAMTIGAVDPSQFQQQLLPAPKPKSHLQVVRFPTKDDEPPKAS